LTQKLRWANRHIDLEPLLNEFEISLSGDFKNMNLEQLKEAEQGFLKLAGMRPNRETISLSDSQRDSRDYLWFRITQEENKHDYVKIGDVFHSSWGYDQTNTEFFKVVEISKTRKTCKVVQVASEEIGDKKENNRQMACSIIPDPNTVIDPRKQQVKIERQRKYNPRTHKHEEIGPINLRGSVFYSASAKTKDLETLFRVTGECYRSWYA